MITFIKGLLVEATLTSVVVDVSGVGYQALVPLSTQERLPSIGEAVTILTHLHVREDAHVLYGFYTDDERELFRVLISSVSGIGPKIALNILSGIRVADFRVAVVNGDVKALSNVQGIGKKTAERIIVELKDKLGKGKGPALAPEVAAFAGGKKNLEDAIQALVTLGVKPQEASKAVEGAAKMLGESAGVEELVRACLKSR